MIISLAIAENIWEDGVTIVIFRMNHSLVTSLPFWVNRILSSPLSTWSHHGTYFENYKEFIVSIIHLVTSSSYILWELKRCSSTKDPIGHVIHFKILNESTIHLVTSWYVFWELQRVYCINHPLGHIIMVHTLRIIKDVLVPKIPLVMGYTLRT